MEFPMINGKRLKQSLEAFSQIGQYNDKSTGLKGVNRLALSDEDQQGRHLFIEWCKELSLQIYVDQIGNLYAVHKGEDDSLPPLFMGSHLDSVPTGGHFDGTLGVLGGLEVIRTLHEHSISTLRSIVIANFTDEEGCRFGTDMLGSAVATGRISLEEAYEKTDLYGVSVEQELRRIGYLGELPVMHWQPFAFLECHIEQGPILQSQSMDVGIVIGVQSIRWFNILLKGRSAHAGTTPMQLRKDPSIVAAQLMMECRRMTQEGFGEGFLATTGVLRSHPGMINVVPNEIALTLDFRNPSDRDMDRADTHIRDYLERIACEEGVLYTICETARTPKVRFQDDLLDLLSSLALSRQYVSQRILSGAGHDAQEWSRICPSAMIFVPGLYEGISHNPREFSDEIQCAKGVQLLCDAVLTLAQSKEFSS